jgi:hypothetical protein
MNFDSMLKNKQYDEIWQKYCSFLDLSISQYMTIQKSLLMEQIELFANCELGLKIMKGQHPRSVEEFRRTVPLTSYEDYADFLLAKTITFCHPTPLFGSKRHGKAEGRPLNALPIPKP